MMTINGLVDFRLDMYALMTDLEYSWETFFDQLL